MVLLAEATSFSIEAVRILPSLVWTGIVIAVLMLFYRPIRWELIPRITGVKALGIEATFVKANLAEAAASSGKPAGTVQNRDQVSRRAARLRDLIQGAKLLLVYAEDQAMEQIVDLFKALECDVSSAFTNDEAIELLKNEQFHAVVTTMTRPGNGIAGQHLAREIYQRSIDIPTIIFVGYYEPDKGVPALTFGITNRIDELLNLVFDALERVRG